MNAIQVAFNVDYTLYGVPEEDSKFLGALQNLLDRRILKAEPASSETPGIDDSDPYVGSIYRIDTGKPVLDSLKEYFVGFVDKVKKYF